MKEIPAHDYIIECIQFEVMSFKQPVSVAHHKRALKIFLSILGEISLKDSDKKRVKKTLKEFLNHNHLNKSQSQLVKKIFDSWENPKIDKVLAHQSILKKIKEEKTSYEVGGFFDGHNPSEYCLAMLLSLISGINIKAKHKSHTKQELIMLRSNSLLNLNLRRKFDLAIARLTA